MTDNCTVGRARVEKGEHCFLGGAVEAKVRKPCCIVRLGWSNFCRGKKNSFKIPTQTWQPPHYVFGNGTGSGCMSLNHFLNRRGKACFNNLLTWGIFDYCRDYIRNSLIYTFSLRGNGDIFSLKVPVYWVEIKLPSKNNKFSFIFIFCPSVSTLPLKWDQSI